MKRYLECFMCVMYTYMYILYYTCNMYIFVCDNLKVQLFIIMMMCGVICIIIAVVLLKYKYKSIN